MARIINNAFPTSNSGSAALGFSFPLSGKAVFNPTFTVKETIKTNLINWLLTNKGERVFRPLFGANLRDFIGEGINEGTNNALETRIKENITIEFPEIMIKRVNFENEPDRNTINLFINYEIRNMGEDEINIAIQ
jgi:phage baseplate assembly protein W|tara:strand:+ start:2666 stop:3070 length:405 start_codon:yes stop_codon:yes gene_type:complete